MNKGYYAVIPASVRYDKELKANEKLLYGEITALCNQEGYCWANNNYFAELYGVSKETISRWVSGLEKQGHIRTKIIYKADSKEVKERRIYIESTYQKSIGIDENVKGSCQENQEPIDEIINTPIDENVKDNTTSFNTTINNTINTTTTTKEKKESSGSSPETLKNKLELDKDFANVVQAYQQEGFGTITTISTQLIEELLEEYSTEWILEAMKIAVESNKRTLKYIRGVLKNWKADGGMKLGGENGGKFSDRGNGSTGQEPTEHYAKLDLSHIGYKGKPYEGDVFDDDDLI